MLITTGLVIDNVSSLEELEEEKKKHIGIDTGIDIDKDIDNVHVGEIYFTDTSYSKLKL